MVGQTDAGLAQRPRELIFLEQAKTALFQASTVDEVKKIRDKAEALKVFCQQQKYGVEIQNEAVEIKLRAERRAGEMLADMKLNGGDRKSESHDAILKLSDVGVSATQSSRWQQVAAVPKDDFEEHLRDTKKAERELTTAGVLKLAKQIEAAAPVPIPIQTAMTPRLTDNLQTFIDAGEKFGCIYADPAWQYGNQGTRAATDNHYPTMPLADICALPVKDIAADNAHLHLWTTNAFLFDAQKVMEAWGFTYKSVMVWVKPSMGIGNYWRVSHEFLLLGIRGSCPFMARNEMSWVNAKREGHSAKPAIFRDKIERVSPGPRIELFSRRAIPGWSAWGNQIEKDLYVKGA